MMAALMEGCGATAAVGGQQYRIGQQYNLGHQQYICYHQQYRGGQQGNRGHQQYDRCNPQYCCGHQHYHHRPAPQSF